MREVNNNPEFGKIPQRTEVKFTAKVDSASSQSEQAVDEASSASFDNHKEVLGRSQVNNLSSVNNDISFGLKYPEKIEKANKAFDLAYKQTGDYARASEVMDAYIKEFS